MPDVGDIRAGRALRVVSNSDGRAELGPVDQHVQTTELFCSPDGLLAYPANHRFAWPAELDLMAQVAGPKRVQRWEDWRRRPYSAASRHHVTVYATSEWCITV